jgi:hypothetical protein
VEISSFKESVNSALVEFAWSQWTQMGVLGRTSRSDRWAADPEALLVFSLDAARRDPRLFDELLDWVVRNGRWLSVQRLRNLCRDDDDRRLCEASLAWAGRQRSTLRYSTPKKPRRDSEPTPLFPSLTPAMEADEVFLEFGLLRPPLRTSGHSREPDLQAPINFAFRLRHVFGVGSRAEIVRYLLTIEAPSVQAQLVAGAAAFAKRNVNETLGSLVDGGVAQSVLRGNEHTYATDRESWSSFLRVDSFPQHVDWPQILWALRTLKRWLDQAEIEEMSEYMRASEARTLIDRIGSELAFAGIPVPSEGELGADYWPAFVETTRRALGALGQDAWS